MIKAVEIYKSYLNGDTKIEVLKGVSFEVSSKEILLVEGPSGSGKTTLLNIISLLDKPDKGSLTLLGEEVDWNDARKMETFRNKHIGYCFQDFYLFPSFTVLENVILPYLPDKTYKELVEKAEAILEELNILKLKDRFPDEISGGEKQRTVFGRALIKDPKILLVDEPTANLDRKTAESMVHLLKQIVDKYEASVIVASHDPLIKKIADKVVKLGA